MTETQGGAPEPPKAPDSVQVMHTGEQPFLTRSARRQALEMHGADIELPPVAHLPRYLTVITTVIAAVLIGVSAAAGEMILAAALLLGSLIIAWGWPGTIGLPSPLGTSVVLGISAVVLMAAVLAADTVPYLRWGSAALAFGLILAFLQQLLRRDGRARLTESVMGATLGLVVLASGVIFLPLMRVDTGPALIACAMVAVAAGTIVDLFVWHSVLRVWLLPLGMVIGGIGSVVASLILTAPAIPPAALIGVCSAALSHSFRRMLSPEPGSYSGPGQIAAGLGSIGLVGALVWVLNEFVVR